MTMKMAMIFFS